MAMTFRTVGVAAALFACFVGLSFSQEAGPAAPTKLVLDLKTDKSTYLPGELVRLTFRLYSRTGDVATPDRFSVTDGSLAVLIAAGPGPFLEYDGPGWGTKRVVAKSVLLQPGKAIESTATLLYDQVPETRHLSALYADQQLAGRIRQEYPLGEPGTYSLKAVFRGGPYSEEPVESAPVSVTVKKPAGPELEAWNILRADPRLGFVLQTGMLPGAPTAAEENHVQDTLGDLISRYPNTVYYAEMQAALTRLRAHVQKTRGGIRRSSESGGVS
jgi:hypothetical protein